MRAFISLAFAAAAIALPHSQEQSTAALGATVRRQSPFRLIPVVVGGPQDSFVPNSVTAAVGDVIQFQFSNGNHTVTQSTETTPCQPLQLTDAKAIHSGHIPFKDGQLAVGTFNMPVTGTEPMFLYCATGPHCQEGQVMVINPKTPEQVVNFVKAAAGAAANIDGTSVVGGAVGTINLEAAAFVPAPIGGGGPPPGAAPPAAAPASSSATAPPASSSAASSAASPTASSPVAEAPAAAPAVPVVGTPVGGLLSSIPASTSNI